MPIILLGYLVAGLLTSIAVFDRASGDAPQAVGLVAAHLGCVVFVAFASIMARKQESGTFLGLSPWTWPAAAAIAYAVGFVAGRFV